MNENIAGYFLPLYPQDVGTSKPSPMRTLSPTTKAGRKKREMVRLAAGLVDDRVAALPRKTLPAVELAEILLVLIVTFHLFRLQGRQLAGQSRMQGCELVGNFELAGSVEQPFRRSDINRLG